MKFHTRYLAICAIAFAASSVLAQGWKPEKGVDIIIGLTVNMLGDGMRDALDPRLARRM